MTFGINMILSDFSKVVICICSINNHIDVSHKHRSRMCGTVDIRLATKRLLVRALGKSVWYLSLKCETSGLIKASHIHSANPVVHLFIGR